MPVAPRMATPVPPGALARPSRAGARSCSGAGGRLRPHASRRLNGGVVRHCVGRAHAMRWKVTIADAKPMRLLMSRDVPGNAAEVTAPARPPLSTQSPAAARMNKRGAEAEPDANPSKRSQGARRTVSAASVLLPRVRPPSSCAPDCLAACGRTGLRQRRTPHATVTPARMHAPQITITHPSATRTTSHRRGRLRCTRSSSSMRASRISPCG